MPKHGGAVDPAGELLPYPAGGDALEAVDQFGDGNLGRVVHQQVDVIAFAVELLQLRLEFLTKTKCTCIAETTCLPRP